MLSAFLIRVLNPQKKPDFDVSEAIAEVLGGVCADLHIDLRQADHKSGVGVITQKMRRDIRDADIVFADANSPNENVWYEIGYADCVNLEKVICIFKSDRTLPFDRRDIRSVEYLSLTDAKFRTELRDAIITVLKKVVFPTLIPYGEIENEKDAADEFVRKLPQQICDLGRQWLLNVVRDASAHHSTARRAAVRALDDLGGLTRDVCVELTRNTIHPSVRAAVYDQLSTSDMDVSPEVWDQPRDLRDQALIDSFAKAITHYWCAGKLDDGTLRRWVRPGLEESLSAVIGNALGKSPG